MKPESEVVEEVVRYFSEDSKFKRFSVEREYPVQIGSDNRRADVVLIDEDGNPAAMIECKKIGYQGSGREQLESYLSATNTPLGVFANSIAPDDWQFYGNLGRNRFEEMTRSQFESRVLKTSIIKSLSNFVREIFSRKQKVLAPKESDMPADEPPAPDESDTLSDESPAPDESDTLFDESPNSESSSSLIVRPPQPPIIYTGRDQTVQSDNSTNVNPSLDGKPYYSEQNGFYWAANHRGMAECVPQHVKHIIHNEELEIKSSREQIQAEIDLLISEKNQLEEQKRDYEQAIGQKGQALAQKKEELAGLEVQLEAITETESDLPSVEESHHDAAQQRLEAEIGELIHQKDGLEQAIGQNAQALAQKKEELTGLEVELEAPTQVELNPTSTNVSARQRFSYSKLITGIIATICLVPLVAYLFIFYASVVDKAFFLDVESLKEKSQDAVEAIDIVNPTALVEAFRKPGNLFVILFPSIFLGVVMITHAFWEQIKQWWCWALIGLVLLVTLMFDFILAIHISQKIHEVKQLAGLIPETEQWTFRWNDLNMLTVIFCGFVVALFVSILYPATIELWKGVRPRRDESKQLEMEIKAERSLTERRIAVLRTEMQNLQNEMDQFTEQVKGVQQKIEEVPRQHLEARIKAERTPIEAKVAVLKAEMENLQNEMDQLNEQIKGVQQEIDQNQAKIDELSTLQNRRFVNRSKMESQINQFLNGWCRFVAHSEDGTSDVSVRIDEIKQVAYETLDQYYEGLQGA